MKIIEQSLSTFPDMYNEGAFRMAEIAGRKCYGSTLHTDPEKTVKFITALGKRKHYGVLEHGSVYFSTKTDTALKGLSADLVDLLRDYEDEEVWKPVCTLKVFKKDTLYVYTNLADIFKFAPKLYEALCQIDKINLKPFKAKFFVPEVNDPLKKYSCEICTERIQTQSITRYRQESSYCQESQRYYDYTEAEFIRPHWMQKDLKYQIIPVTNEDQIIKLSLNGHEIKDVKAHLFIRSCYDSENNYKQRRQFGLEPEDARGAFTNEIASSIIVTKTVRAWKHLHNQRCNDATGKAHPQIKLLFNSLPDLLKHE